MSSHIMIYVDSIGNKNHDYIFFNFFYLNKIYYYFFLNLVYRHLYIDVYINKLFQTCSIQIDLGIVLTEGT